MKAWLLKHKRCKEYRQAYMAVLTVRSATPTLGQQLAGARPEMQQLVCVFLQDRRQQPSTTAATAAHLQLALACNNTAAALAAARKLPAALNPPWACRMMAIAASRGHGWLALLLSCKRGMEKHISAPMLEFLLRQLMTKDTIADVMYIAQQHNMHDIDSNLTCAKTFLHRQLPAAAQLGSDAVADLLHVAVCKGCVDSMQRLLCLDGARELSCSSEFLAEMLQIAIEHGSYLCVMDLCELPAAKFLSSSTVGHLLQAAPGAAAAASQQSVGQNVEDISTSSKQETA
jgi:hypothetical protein